jgi:hypothetical protein
LRTARAYAFLQNFLLATVGEEWLSPLHGLRKYGKRELNLAAELESMRLRFYGFYLVACEDLGMEPQLLSEEPVDQGAAKESALKWLALLESPDLHVDEPDLSCDTRMSIPIATDPARNVIRLWATLGVRLVPLEANYARPPKVRPIEKGNDTNDSDLTATRKTEYELEIDKSGWANPPSYTVGKSEYVLAIDEFAEFELSGSASFTREEFQAICEKNNRNKDQILQALKSHR